MMLAVALIASAGGCRQRETEPPDGSPPPPVPPEVEMEILIDMPTSSTAFEDGGEIPATYTCDGKNISPPMSWEPAPEGTKELAILVQDMDAPEDESTLWVAWGISPEVTSLPAGASEMADLPALKDAVRGRNDAGNLGYDGPCPPPGEVHEYAFVVYAFDIRVALTEGATAQDLWDATEGHSLADGELFGTYSRRPG
jgi:Raf kinase inhibitor-like YbhB/YbcL family protein